MPGSCYKHHPSRNILLTGWGLTISTVEILLPVLKVKTCMLGLGQYPRSLILASGHHLISVKGFVCFLQVYVEYIPMRNWQTVLWLLKVLDTVMSGRGLMTTIDYQENISQTYLPPLVYILWSAVALLLPFILWFNKNFLHIFCIQGSMKRGALRMNHMWNLQPVEIQVISMIKKGGVAHHLI